MQKQQVRDLYLAIDVGTGGLRSAIVDGAGHILAFSHKEHEQIVPRYGWSEQRPEDWWHGTLTTMKDVLAKVENAHHRIAAICCCGQMHGSVLIDDSGKPALEAVPLWNDKRNIKQVEELTKSLSTKKILELTANTPSPAWPALKVAWIAENQPEALARSTTLLMPKDWINFKLTGKRAQDYTEASLSFLMDWQTRQWSDELCEITGVSRDLLPDLHAPEDILGGLDAKVAAKIGLSADIPVLVGAGDYPMALIGSGVIKQGMGSDVTGTSTIVTLMHDGPILKPQVSNVLSANGVWGAMTLLDAGGDAPRWARRAFHDNQRSYAEITEDAHRSEVGANGLFFLPYLSGERFGDYKNSRAQFFGLTAEHNMADLHRAVLEGVAFSVRRVLDEVDKDGRPEAIIAASGGAKNHLWLEIKASMYNVAYRVPQELECGIVGAAMLMATSTGAKNNVEDAAQSMVRFSEEIMPSPQWVERYNRMMPIYERLYKHSQQFYHDLDKLT
ncbi:MAG: xylulokinase [Alphaproteobacteria bacterium]